MCFLTAHLLIGTEYPSYTFNFLLALYIVKNHDKNIYMEPWEYLPKKNSSQYPEL